MPEATSVITFEQLTSPTDGAPIHIVDGKLVVPNDPIIPVIEGDGIGADIMHATRHVLDGAVQQAYQDDRRLVWFEVPAGEAAHTMYGDPLPADTVKAIEHFLVALKGPLTTPVGGGYRSLNVTMRQRMDLYACVRPVKWLRGVPSPVRHPEHMDVVIYRENTEDVYAGIEWAAESPEAIEVIKFLRDRFNSSIRDDAGIGIKPISRTATKRLVRAAIQYALKRGRRSVTLVHKGNIMKYTEGAFRDWGYELAREEFPDTVVSEQDLGSDNAGDRIIINDRIADSMFQQVLTRTQEYDVLALPNLNGDYLSDACAAQIGGLGMAPGGNFGDRVALFEATHGTAPKYAGQDRVNPGSLILSGVMMLDHLGWGEAAKLVVDAMERTIEQKRVTYDLERQMDGATLLKCSEYGDAIVGNMQ